MQHPLLLPVSDKRIPRMAEAWVLSALMHRDANGERFWWTDAELQRHVNSGSEGFYGLGSIGARRRDLRKRGHVIESRRRKGHRGLWEYRLKEAGR